MYKKGELQIGAERDTRTDDYASVFGAFLPHSCNEWIIGGPDEIKALIEDLGMALVKLGALEKAISVKWHKPNG